ncbi:MAG: 4-hydroxy-tetrahydrodipicolinate synthase [Sulfurimonas sp.]|jgi:4-hydroxy-tetrahydrodipicolinate synthase|uniref:4-hydroxy-tetrahydrodipicolinate synthase n=1 Tax=unclassified Sulfurimonas TaxID=2623549 RepID=UPI0008ADD687|nr:MULTISPECIES: 4-hydroxy-tetrahydrodipicolinate synthase [unclassified Sulfurimonas]MBS4069056.1 4-hydroxy-tetrahydrodipicolinate synthase [Sulfurimonas sp.]MDD3856024.1 4-hydroxy-tetrahydrodipicolinate synthase [Sulfurimonas sp.]OHE04964.1 MAG: 4-hydroxy-tetrahydrodipicolinate synthase [Sulfurimonas sp. RIFOXYB12_FULL_35_9]OHE11276.1 MAG: 4-hydroxy-tetrahydrodipicolinate synthase [Sulfurimonas sp. RIFOXYB2_FULL_37_5]
MNIVTGSTTALITPFKNGKLDEESYAKLIRRQIKGGINAVCPVGTTGESAMLTYDEDRRCIEIAVEVCRGTNTKVLAGAGSNSTAEAIEAAKTAQKCGVDAIFSVAPYYVKPSQEGLYQHYKAIAESVGELPFMLYNVPGRTVVDISADTVIRLFDDVKNIYGIKEATGSLERTIELLSRRPELKVFSGDDAIDFPILANGGAGITSVTSNLLPDLKSQLVDKALSGDFKGAKALNDMLFPINKALFLESNPIMIKAAMYIAGLIDTLEYRLPLVPPSVENMKKLETIMKNYEIKGL